MKSTTEKIAISGILVALDVLLTRVLAFNTPIMKIGLGFLAVALCGALFGPCWAAVCGALADIAGSLIFPTGAYFPGFTLTAALTGAVFGLLLRPYSKKRAVIAAVVNTVAISYLANTYLISVISGTAYKELLAARGVQPAFMIPIQVIMLTAVLPVIARQTEKISQNRKKGKKTLD